MRVMTATGAACLLALALAGPDVYAQKGRPLAAPGSFRCTAGVPNDTCPAPQDAVRDDDGTAYNFLLSSGEGSQLNTNGEYYLWFQTGGSTRFLTVDLSEQLALADCDQNGPCYYQEAWGTTLPTIDIHEGWLRTNVVDTLGNELKGGLLALPCGGGAHNSRMLITFSNATKTQAATVSMTLRWYPQAFGPSHYVKITRSSRSVFTIEAPEDGATAVLMGAKLVRGKLQNTRTEGVFHMPFKLQVTVPGAPAKTGCGES